MLENPKKARDAFTFSLGGMTTVASFAFAPAIADDRINKVRDEQLRQTRPDQDQRLRPWLRFHLQPREGVCA